MRSLLHIRMRHGARYGCHGRMAAALPAGQDSAKQLIQEMVVWPVLNPTLFMVRTAAANSLRRKRERMHADAL